MQMGYTPWLNDNVNWKRYTSLGVQGADTFWYRFETIQAQSVSAVVLWMEGYGGDLGQGYGCTAYEIYIQAEGVPLTLVGEVNPDSPWATWYPFDISDILDTPAKVNSTEIKLLAINKGSPKTNNTVYAQRCYLAVTYVPSVAKAQLIGDGLACVSVS